MTAAGSWRAWHVYLGAPEQFDRFVVEALPGLADGKSSWFFIRYGEGGPHLRVRLHSDDETAFAAAASALRTHAEGIIAAGVDEDWYRRVSFPAARSAQFPPGTVAEQPYEPETARYGGPHAIGINERLFCASSQLAVRMVVWSGGAPGRREGQAIDLMLAAAASLFDAASDAASFFSTYASGWRHYFAERGRPLDPGTEQPGLDPSRVARRFGELAAVRRTGTSAAGAGAAWVLTLSAACARLLEVAAEGQLVSPTTGLAAAGGESCRPALANMMGSQMHMMNNRLGYSPIDEMPWALALARSLESAENEASH